MNHPEFVEAKDVRFLDISPVLESSEKINLHVQGYIFHSSLAVGSVELRSEGENVWIMIGLTPTGKGKSGRFDIDVPMPSARSVIYFGPAKKQIWPVLTR